MQSVISKKVIIFGSGDDGRRLYNLFPTGSVEAFVDNDVNKVGGKIGDVSICSPDYLLTLSEDYIVIVGVSDKFQKEIITQLEDMGIKNYMLPSQYLNMIEVASHEKLRSLRNKYLGKTCFLVGTGPSLRIADLEKLKEQGIMTMASNKIFKLFDETEWRPDLYCISDIDVFSFYYDRICDLDIPIKFLVNLKNTRYGDKVDLQKLHAENHYVFDIYKKCSDEQGTPCFSTEADKFVVDGGITVTYSMLQWAYYLGFRKVYLLGVDFNYGDLSGADVSSADHFCQNYNEKGEVINNPKIKESLMAYRVAYEFGQKNEFEIFNATRGGKLEVYPRVDFDSLF